MSEIQFEILDDLDLTDSPWKIPDSLKELVDELYSEVIKGKSSVKKKIMKLIRQHPDVPVFRNYLACWYQANGLQDEAMIENDTTLRLFPDYIFASCSAITENIRKGNIEKAGEALGNELTITAFCPGRRKFHLNEFYNYTKAVVEYLSATEKYEEAEARIRELEKYGTDADKIEDVESIIAYYRWKSRIEDFRYRSEILFNTIERQEPTLPQIEVIQQPTDEKFAFLYGDLWEIDAVALEQSITTGRDSLINELHHILLTAIEGYAYCEDEDEWSAAVLHAVLVLSHIDAEKSFPKVLELLRQPDFCIDFWLGDWAIEALQSFFNRGTSEMLHLIKDFILEELVSEHAKNILLEALPLMVINRPDMRPEVTAVLKEILKHFEAHHQEETLFNPAVLAFAVGAAIDISATELMDDIRRLYDKGLVDLTIEGDVREVEREMYKKDRAHRWTIYTDINEQLRSYIKANNQEAEDDEAEDNLYDDRKT